MTGIAAMAAALSGPVSVSISPASVSSSSRVSATNSANFTASASGGTVSSYAWGLLSGTGAVLAGGSSAIATLQVTDPVANDFSPGTADFYCDMLVNGTSWRATCAMDHDYNV